MAIEESLVVKGVLEGLKSGTRDGYITTLERFVNEFAEDMTVEQLVEEAKSNVRKTQRRIDGFFQWLQSEKGLSHNSARIYAYGYLRGFFSNLDINFERKWL